MKDHGIAWNAVTVYSPKSNGKAEWMVGTIKEAVGRLVEGDPSKWAEKWEAGVAGYRRRPTQMGKSLFELIYGVKPRLMAGAVVWSALRNGTLGSGGGAGIDRDRKTERKG